MTPEPNSRDTAAVTLGIGRPMWLTPEALAALVAEGTFLTPAQVAALAAAARASTRDTGGGDANGTAANILLYQSGTLGDRLGSNRLPPCSGNYCGVI